MDDNPYLQPETQTEAPKSSPWRWVIRGFVTLVILFLLVALLLPATRRGGGEPSRRTQCKNNLKQIALALHNYYDVYGSLPPAYTVDADGRPLHSWRTLILPFLEQRALYDSIDLTRSWADPVNKRALTTRVPEYMCPSTSLENGLTTYVAVMAQGGCFDSVKGRTFSEVTDGTSNTLMICEVPRDAAVMWMSPADADESVIVGMNPDSKFAHTGGFQAALVDGSVRYISGTVPDDTIRALISVAGEEMTPEF